MTAQEELESLNKAYWILVPSCKLPEPIQDYLQRCKKHIGKQRDAIAARLLAEICEEPHE